MAMSRPSVSIEQAIPLAFELFSLRVSNNSTVKELESYEDRNFLMKGHMSTEAGSKVECSDHEEQYVLKILNPIASKRLGTISLTLKVLIFLKEQGIQCPIPQLSVFGGSTVWCRFQRQEQAFDEAFKEKDIVNGVRLIFKDDNVYKSLHSVDNNSDLCAVCLYSFIPGDVICDVKWNAGLLFDFGVKLGNMQKVLKEFCQTRDFLDFQLETSGDNPWDLRNTPDSIIKNCHVIEDDSRRNLIQNIAEYFQKHILPEIKQLETQVIHGDLNEHNVIVEQRTDSTVEIKGFIDFGELHVSHRVLDVGVAVAYFMMEGFKHGMRAIDASSHIIRGYQTVLSMSSLEKEMVFEASKVCICHSLVMGAYNYKYVCPGNEYALYTSETGWNALNETSQTPLSDILNSWRSE